MRRPKNPVKIRQKKIELILLKKRYMTSNLMKRGSISLVIQEVQMAPQRDGITYAVKLAKIQESQYQVLTRMWSSWKALPLLVEKYIVQPLPKQLAAPNMLNINLLRSSHYTLRALLQINENVHPHKDLYMNVHKSSDRSRAVNTQRAINKDNKQNVAYLYNEMHKQ